MRPTPIDRPSYKMTGAGMAWSWLGASRTNSTECECEHVWLRSVPSRETLILLGNHSNDEQGSLAVTGGAEVDCESDRIFGVNFWVKGEFL
ncbi:unnamed protein product [Tuwongella immobilis]|uniref:Uncharacterized protein n=1 Tax=Tuwongella immobilis TaxID=692036 RepID=A0A6C2YQ02_9BACT|nr:unnamed protein product [Tuwongella immobilis]VTS04804.1 unnamed protein product [Tuwongella immobilis]